MMFAQKLNEVPKFCLKFFLIQGTHAPCPLPPPIAYAYVSMHQYYYSSVVQWLGRRTRDRKVESSTPGRCIAGQPRSTQPSTPPGQVNRVPAYWLVLRRGAFTCVAWQVTLCDPIWQVTSRSCEMGVPLTAIHCFTFLLFYPLLLLLLFLGCG